MLTEFFAEFDLREAGGAEPRNTGTLHLEGLVLLPQAAATCICRKRDLLCQFINQMVAVAFELKPADLIDGERGNLRKSRARQIAMYLMNTALAKNFIEIGDFYGRDRTTVSHACRVVENLRDIPAFDDRLGEFENTLSLVFSLSGFPEVGA